MTKSSEGHTVEREKIEMHFGGKQTNNSYSITILKIQGD